MISDSHVRPLVELLNGWQDLLLCGRQRAMFLTWMGDHTRLEIHPETFREKLTEWLLGMSDMKTLYAEALTIHAEILWTSHKVDE